MLELVPRMSISAKLLNLFKYFNEFLKIFLLKFKKLFKTVVEITLTLEVLLIEKFPFVMA